MILQQLVNALTAGSVYALFALGLTLVFGIHKILNLAHGAVFMSGAFAGLFCVVSLGLPLAIALPIACVFSGLLSLLLDWLAFRPLRKRGASEFAAIVTSIGAGLMLTNIAQRFSHTQVLRYPFGTVPVVVFEMGSVRISLLQIIIIACVFILVGSLVAYLYMTSFGRQIRAVAISESTAEILGVNPDAVYFQTFFLAGALAGAAGVLIGIAFNSVHFLMGEHYMLLAFVVIILGGLGSIPGALVAGLLLGVIRTFTVAYVSTELSDLIVFSVLFATLLIRPSGLFGALSQYKRVVRE